MLWWCNLKLTIATRCIASKALFRARLKLWAQRSIRYHSDWICGLFHTATSHDDTALHSKTYERTVSHSASWKEASRSAHRSRKSQLLWPHSHQSSFLSTTCGVFCWLHSFTAERKVTSGGAHVMNVCMLWRVMKWVWVILQVYKNACFDTNHMRVVLVSASFTDTHPHSLFLPPAVVCFSWPVPANGGANSFM